MEGIGSFTWRLIFCKYIYINHQLIKHTRKDKRLYFAAMDEFMDLILGAIKDHVSTGVTNRLLLYYFFLNGFRSGE
jgi:hypothetical protein